MSSKNFKWILYSITTTIVITIAVQFYWNYNNYLSNKKRVTNDIQISLDNALEEYYAEIAKTDFLTIIKSDSESTIWKNNNLDSLNISQIKFEGNKEQDSDSLLIKMRKELNKKLSSENKKPVDSIIGFTQILDQNSGFHFERGETPSKVQVLKGKKAFDSLKVLQKKIGSILISIDRDTLEYSKIDSLLKIQLNQKDIITPYALKHFKKDSLLYNSNMNLGSKSPLSVTSKSTYLKSKEKIDLQFKNPYKDALKLSFSGILISLLLSTAIIFCLFYLLKIIKHQKQISELKNDLISNITHEFKTPIATIGVALESISNFNAIDDKEKTKKYLNMSSEQLGKLNIMVEKLLETATLDSDSLELKKENFDIVELLQALTSRYRIQYPEKTFTHHFQFGSLMFNADIFHIENALNNVLDNAVKYGGNIISVDVIPNDKSFQISISDNGNTLTKTNKDQIFEKFYRVPKGNTHNVKGFGIGLYYTKTIIEKHNGSINLELQNKLTTFKIILPNGQ